MLTARSPAHSRKACLGVPPGLDGGIVLNPMQHFTLHRDEAFDHDAVFAKDVRLGLAAEPKFLWAKYFYDEIGSALFEVICLLPEYYVTLAELEILTQQIDDILARVSAPGRVIELGSGSADKARIFVEGFLKRRSALHYVPVDISQSALELSSEQLLSAFSDLRVTAFAADYEVALKKLHDRAARGEEEKTLVLFLGGTIGNLDGESSQRLLSQVRGVLRKGDSLLLGTDLKKPEEILLPAYNDALGVTAAFNLNVLRRINREFGGDFALDQFEHEARYNREHGRIEMHLISRKEQVVNIHDLDLEVPFRKGESIHTESSYKFDAQQIEELAGTTGFKLDHVWYDSNRYFALNLMIVE